ncbi:MAG: LacI family DNA-binding transcriptional regulator [Bacteroidales bacterium]|nr:LacI family DNA-binding transcriptional regulator [Bacteroidales bacterium]
MAQNEKITILDIARRTGLSKGTVDRVLHHRGEVSRRSYDKVMAAIEELGYEPNVYASLLAKGQHHLVAVLIPAHEPGTFWELAAGGIDKAAESVGTLGVRMQHFEYDQYDIESFRAACARVLEAGPSGVVIAPLFQEETDLFAAQLREHGIPFAYIDSKPETDGYLAYFGMPLYKSGYLCADQLTGGFAVPSALIVRIRRDRNQQSDPTINRRAGFVDYMLEHSPDCILGNVFIDPNDPDSIEGTLDAWFREHPGTRHIVMFNSRIHLLVPWLQRHPDSQRRVVGFDNLKANMDALREGTVSCLIAQHPDEQMRLAIEALAEYILRRKLPLKKDNFMHMDILTRYNVDYY